VEDLLGLVEQPQLSLVFGRQLLRTPGEKPPLQQLQFFEIL
jgi:hypothetical protein